jgi:uncharacterized membrane protein YkoI
MKKLAASLCLSCVAVSVVFAADDAMTVQLSDTPAAVQKTIAAEIGNGTVQDVSRSTQNGETIFEVDFAGQAGDERDFTVADDGTLLCTGVALADTPAPVQKTIQAQLSGWPVTGINKNVADTDLSFDVTVAKDGHEKSFNVDAAGNLSSMELALTDAPAAVQATIKAQIANGSLRTIDENFDAEGNSFDVEAVAPDGGRKTFSVAPDGRLLSEGMTLEQVPPAARRTITEKIGDGKILEIDKSLFEKKDGVLPYAVQGRKAGREFDFSVGPRGRFLGMDQ